MLFFGASLAGESRPVALVLGPSAKALFCARPEPPREIGLLASIERAGLLILVQGFASPPTGASLGESLSSLKSSSIDIFLFGGGTGCKVSPVLDEPIAGCVGVSRRLAMGETVEGTDCWLFPLLLLLLTARDLNSGDDRGCEVGGAVVARAVAAVPSERLEEGAAGAAEVSLRRPEEVWGELSR